MGLRKEVSAREIFAAFIVFIFIYSYKTYLEIVFIRYVTLDGSVSYEALKQPSVQIYLFLHAAPALILILCTLFLREYPRASLLTGVLLGSGEILESIYVLAAGPSSPSLNFVGYFIGAARVAALFILIRGFYRQVKSHPDPSERTSV